MTILSELKKPVATFWRKLEARRIPNAALSITYDDLNSTLTAKYTGMAVNTAGTEAYLCGWDSGGTGGSARIIIEKRNAATGLLLTQTIDKIVETTTALVNNRAVDIAIDDSFLYVCGFSERKVGINAYWWAQARNRSTFSITWFTSYFPTSITDTSAPVRIDASDPTNVFLLGHVYGSGDFANPPTGGNYFQVGSWTAAIPVSTAPTTTANNFNVTLISHNKTTGTKTNLWIETRSTSAETISSFGLDLAVDTSYSPSLIYVLYQVIANGAAGTYGSFPATGGTIHRALYPTAGCYTSPVTAARQMSANFGVGTGNITTSARALYLWDSLSYAMGYDAGSALFYNTIGSSGSTGSYVWSLTAYTTTYQVNRLDINTSGGFMVGNFDNGAGTLSAWFRHFNPARALYNYKDNNNVSVFADFYLTSTGLADGQGKAIAVRGDYVHIARDYTTNIYLTRAEYLHGAAALETSWTDLTEHVKSWGTIRTQLDQYNFGTVVQSGVQITLKNDTGIFDVPSNTTSFWTNAISRYGTFIRISAGLIDSADSITQLPNGSSIQSSSVQYLGIIEQVKQTNENETIIDVAPLDSILRQQYPLQRNDTTSQVPKSVNLDFNTLSSSILLSNTRDGTFGSHYFSLRKYISTGAWNIEATTLTLGVGAITTTGNPIADSYNCLTFGQELAKITGKVFFVNRIGTVNWISRTPTSAVSFIFAGDGFDNRVYGHTIKALTSYEQNTDLLYNSLKITYNTSGSYTILSYTQSIGSVMFGSRRLDIDMSWFNTTTVIADIGSLTLAEFGRVKEHVSLRCKFIPILNILDRTQIQYSPGDNTAFDFTGKDYKIIGLEHNLDTAETNVTLREI